MVRSQKPKRAALLALTITMAFCLCPGPMSFADEDNAAAEPPITLATSVSGLKTGITKSASSTISDTIQLTNSHEGTLKLQLHNISKNTWSTKASYQLAGGETEKITITYPQQWKSKITTEWRVSIPATDGYESYISPTITITATNIGGLSVSSKALAIYRADDGKLLYSKNATKKLPNASTTKMLTALIILEEGKLSSYATYSSKAASTPYGILYAKTGTKIKVSNLLKSLLISSSNDSAVCLAEFSSGSVKTFAKKMNARAKELGCTGTSFKNPHGLTETDHYSTAKDLCIIQAACLQYSKYKAIISSKAWSFKDKTGKQSFGGTSTDKLLGEYAGFLGGKTGYTKAAGQCFSGVYVRNGETYVFTLLGNSSSEGRWNDAKAAINYLKKYA